jgi:hypothetical protein
MAMKGFFETVLRTVGMLAMVLVFGFVLAACKDDPDDIEDKYPELPASVGTNELGGKTYGPANYRKVVFNANTAYTWYDSAESGAEFVESSNGNYSWNTTTNTVTLAPKKLLSPDGGMLDMAGLRAYLQAHPEYLVNDDITYTVEEVVARHFALKTYGYVVVESTVTVLNQVQ